MRAAIVVGNGAYQGHAALENPANDAQTIARELKELGFNVFHDHDLDRDQFIGLFEKFLGALEKSGKSEVGLIYYSGHGLQHHGTNYLVPIGAENSSSDQVGKMISLQDFVDQITPYTHKRLIILDACRSSPTSDILEESVENTKGYYFDKDIVTANGLAEIEAQTNTFFAFAAGPGKFAYDGKGDLSPFTQALVKNISAVDLPLPNLTARIRNDVLAATDDKQQTWDTSSLKEPFFFNPGSLLLLIGNAIGIVALMMALLPYTMLLLENAGLFWSAVGGALLVFILILLMAGLNNAYARLRGEKQPGDPDDEGRGWSAQIIRKGFTGGVFGGVIAAFLVAVPYELLAVKGVCAENEDACTQLPPFGQLLTEITLAGVLVAAMLGVFCLWAAERLPGSSKFAQAFGKHLSQNQKIILGAIIGGIATGFFGGPLLTMYFGQYNRPFLTPEIFAPGATLGTAVIAFAIVNYSLEKFSLPRLRKSALGIAKALIIAGAAGAASIGFLDYIGFTGEVYIFARDIYWANAEDTFANPGISYIKAYGVLALAGLIYGLVIGPFLGLLIGLTLIWNPEHK